MSSNEVPDEKQKKGLLKRPVRVWKLTAPLWLAVIIGCCVLSVGVSVVDSGLRSVGVLPTETPTLAPTDIPTLAPTDTLMPTDTPGPTDTPA